MRAATKKRRLAQSRRPKGRWNALADIVLRRALADQQSMFFCGANRLGKTEFLRRCSITINDEIPAADLPPLSEDSADSLALFKFDKRGFERVKEGTN